MHNHGSLGTDEDSDEDSIKDWKWSFFLSFIIYERY